MIRVQRAIPPFIYPALWSYDPRRMDVRTSAETIITQVLNYGDWKMVRWLLKVYDPATIRTVVAHPRRGVWSAQALNLWLTLYGIALPSWWRRVAVRNLDHAGQDWRALRRYMSHTERVRKRLRMTRFTFRRRQVR